MQGACYFAKKRSFCELSHRATILVALKVSILVERYPWIVQYEFSPMLWWKADAIRISPALRCVQNNAFGKVETLQNITNEA